MAATSERAVPRSLLYSLIVASVLLGSACATERYLGSDAFAESFAASSNDRRTGYWLLDDTGTNYLIVEKGPNGPRRYQVEKRRLNLVGVAPEAPLPLSLKRENIRLQKD